MIKTYLYESISLLQSLYNKVSRINVDVDTKTYGGTPLVAADDEAETDETQDTPSAEETLTGEGGDESGEGEGEQTNVKTDTKELFALNTIFSTIKYLEGVIDTIRKITNDEKLLNFSFKLQELKQIFYDFVDNIEMYDEDEQKEIIKKIQLALLKYIKLLMQYLKDEF